MSAVVVTGGAGGIGREMVRQLLRSGMTVWSVDQAGRGSGSEDHPPGLIQSVVDLREETAVGQMVAELEASGEEITGLINAAGIVHRAPLLETSVEEWDRLMEVNARAVFLMIREVAGLMVRQRAADPGNRRSIVTIGSNAGKTPRTEFGAYGASKAAAASVTQSFGLQLARHGIRCNVISPGTTRTPMVTTDWNGEDLSAGPVAGTAEDYRLGIPLGRIAEPEDIASMALYLLSPTARHVTMQNITVDGGATF